MGQARGNPGLTSPHWKIDYLGWSGFHIHHAGADHIFVDPPKGTAFPRDAEVTIFITHGHPEHLGGILDLIRKGTAGPGVRVMASPTVCRYLARQNLRTDVTFHAVKPGAQKILDPAIGIEVFEWRHMPLLPPGAGAAVRHVLHILRRWPDAWRVIKMSLRGPRGAGKMLGYLLRLKGDRDFIIYGEGLHRRTAIEQVAAIGQRAAGATLLVAAEPEDFAQLPQLVAASGASEAILYEPHRPWRDIFSLPHVDLTALQAAVAAAGVKATVAESGQ